MAARRNRIPPFEVMHRSVRHAGERESAPIISREPERSGSAAPRTGLAVPLVLRLPRGLAMLVGAVVLGLIIAAYFVGYARGQSAATAQRRHQQTAGVYNPDIPAPPGNFVIDETSHPTGGQPRPGRSSAVAGRDPRQVGLNYMVLAHASLDGANKIQAFFIRQGVATLVIPADNKGLYRVIAVDRGFTAAQLDTAQRRDYENRLRKLGRDWKRYNKGHGDDLASMFFRKYEGGS